MLSSSVDYNLDFQYPCCQIDRKVIEQIMALLLGRRGDDVEITKEVVEAAAGNPGSGRKVMALLLGDAETTLKITDRLTVFKVVAGNY